MKPVKRFRPVRCCCYFTSLHSAYASASLGHARVRGCAVTAVRAHPHNSGTAWRGASLPAAPHSPQLGCSCAAMSPSKPELATRGMRGGDSGGEGVVAANEAGAACAAAAANAAGFAHSSDCAPAGHAEARGRVWPAQRRSSTASTADVAAGCTLAPLGAEAPPATAEEAANVRANSAGGSADSAAAGCVGGAVWRRISVAHAAAAATDARSAVTVSATAAAAATRAAFSAARRAICVSSAARHVRFEPCTTQGARRGGRSSASHAVPADARNTQVLRQQTHVILLDRLQAAALLAEAYGRWSARQIQRIRRDVRGAQSVARVVAATCGERLCTAGHLAVQCGGSAREARALL